LAERADEAYVVFVLADPSGAGALDAVIDADADRAGLAVVASASRQ
jgi:hypothetical protein